MEFKDLLPLLQGVSSPALVVLLAFAWTVSKQVTALTGALAEQTKALYELDKRLAIIEEFIERRPLVGNGRNGGVRKNVDR